MTAPPSGTVTFLFTDIEGSTRLWEQSAKSMQAAVDRHNRIVRQAVEGAGGYVFKTAGDSFCAAFATAPEALAAALAAQRMLYAEAWSGVGPLRVRAGLHTGTVQERESDYFGPVVSRASRVMAAGHGGQTLVSHSSFELLRDQLPPETELRDLGEHRLKDLFRPERIFQVVVPDLPADFPPLNTLDSRPNNLPTQPTPLIGREPDLRQLDALLRRPEVRVVTLTGPGGIGKTRLALQVAADLLDHFRDGVWLVNLAPLARPDLVPPAIARVLGVGEHGGRQVLESLRAYLHGRQTLLVLDNFEQVLQAAPALAELMQGAPEVKLLATSRSPLRLRGEVERPVPPLTLPDPQHLPSVDGLSQFEAMRLFIERATSVNPDFQVTNESAPAVAEICARLDGLPLAIELAAARVRLLPPQAMLSRLHHRLRLLTGGSRDLPARQQTLRSTIEWSYDLLDDMEKPLFRRLAAFSGGCSLEAIEAVCNCDGALALDVLDGVESLVEKSLLTAHLPGRASERVTVAHETGVEPGRGDGVTARAAEAGEADDLMPRFSMLETIQEFAAEKLEESGETDALRRAHLGYFTAMAEEAEPHLRGPGQVEWLRTLDREQDNVRAALSWATQGGTRSGATRSSTFPGLRLAAAFWRFWELRGFYSEAIEQLSRVLALSAGVPAGGAATEGVSAGEERDAAVARARVLYGMGYLSWRLGRPARELFEESLAMSRALGDTEGTADSLEGLGLSIFVDDLAGARSLFEESMSIRRDSGNATGLAHSLNNLAMLAAWELGDYAAARRFLGESLSIIRDLGDRWGEALVLTNLGDLAYIKGDYAVASRLVEAGLAIRRGLEDRWGMAVSLLILAELKLAEGDWPAARGLLQEGLPIAEELRLLPQVAFGRVMMGYVARREGGFAGAEALFRQGLALSTELADPWTAVASLGGLAGVAGATGRALRGACLLGATAHLVDDLPSRSGSRLSRAVQAELDYATAIVRKQLDEDSFTGSHAQGYAMTPEQAIEYALEGET